MAPHGFCNYHCRGCDGHFTSLEAFDRHLVGQQGKRTCGDADELCVEVSGLCQCRISGRGVLAPVTLYESPRAQEFRDHMNARHATINSAS